MQTLPTTDEMYAALVRGDRAFEGIFIVGVKTTGVCCRPTCSARKPKRENVEFFGSVREALSAGYRPCKKCRPLEPIDAVPEWLRDLVAAVDGDPTRRWRDADLRDLGLEPARVRRWFQRHHGMTFQAYGRARRLGAALGHIGRGADLTHSGFAAGFESTSGFRDAFRKMFGNPPGRARSTRRVAVDRIATPLGTMVAGATDDALCLLEFSDRRMLQTQIDRLRKLLAAEFVPATNEILEHTTAQLGQYFDGTRREFDIPLTMPGTEFQRAVWNALLTIPAGETRSYRAQAEAIGRPDAVRAVGRANGDNRIAILVPCHRVVGANGELTGYGGQLWRKKALLELER